MRELLLVILLVLCFIGCSTEADQITAHAPAGAAPAISLNEGRKWHTDDETAAAIRNMNGRTKQFATQADFTSLPAYQELGQTLNGELNSLYRNCTITGPAFGELQKLLEPVAADILIMQGKDLNAASAAELRIEERLASFPDFFE